jgi:CheY-like chemotaxis protein
VILLDVHLPDMDGMSVLRKLKADPETAGIPVVVVSADATSSQRKRMLGSGAVAYITKPIDVVLLSKTVQDLITE